MYIFLLKKKKEMEKNDNIYITYDLFYGNDHLRESILKEFKTQVYADPKSAKYLIKESY